MGIEWDDNHGKTPLWVVIVLCTILFILIYLGTE